MGIADTTYARAQVAQENVVKPTNPDLIFYTDKLGAKLWVYDPHSTPSWFNAATGQYSTNKPSGLITFTLQGPVTQDQSNLFPYLNRYVTGIPASSRPGAPQTTSYQTPIRTTYQTPDRILRGGGAAATTTAAPKIGDTRQSQIPGYWEQWDGFKWVLVPVAPPAQGPAPAPYASTRQAEIDRQAFEAEQARLNRAAAAAEAERNRLEQLRQSRFSALQTIVDRFISEQGNASRLVAGLGPDQFKMAAALQGLPVLGTTPQAGFARAQTEFANRPVPNVSAEAPLSDIESAIAAIGGIKPPALPTSGFGMALGGTLPAQPGMQPMMPLGSPPLPPMGPPAAPGAPQFGTTKTAVLVGEGNLQVEPGTEVAVTDTATGTTEIIPLTGQAQGGASIFSGGFAARPSGSVFDPISGVAAINPLYAGLGLSSFPTRTGTPGPWATYPSASTLGRLGYSPSLVHGGTPGQGTVYWRDPTTDQYRGITSADVFNRSGFNWADVVSMNMAGLPVGPPTSFPTFPPGTGSQSFSQKLGQPLVEPITGAILPSPRANAFRLAQLSASNPGLFETALQAYESAGLTRQAVLGSLTNILITGRDQGTIGLR